MHKGQEWSTSGPWVNLGLSKILIWPMRLYFIKHTHLTIKWRHSGEQVASPDRRWASVLLGAAVLTGFCFTLCRQPAQAVDLCRKQGNPHPADSCTHKACRRRDGTTAASADVLLTIFLHLCGPTLTGGWVASPTCQCWPKGREREGSASLGQKDGSPLV